MNATIAIYEIEFHNAPKHIAISFIAECARCQRVIKNKMKIYELTVLHIGCSVCDGRVPSSSVALYELLCFTGQCAWGYSHVNMKIFEEKLKEYLPETSQN